MPLASSIDRDRDISPVEALLAAFQSFQSQTDTLTTRFVTRFGVGPNELKGLLTINALGSITLKELGGALGLIPSTVTFLVDRLAHVDYVRRTPNPKDRRSQIVVLTASGRAVVEQIWDTYRMVFVDSLDAREMTQLTRGFLAVSKTMQLTVVS